MNVYGTSKIFNYLLSTDDDEIHTVLVITSNCQI